MTISPSHYSSSSPRSLSERLEVGGRIIDAKEPCFIIAEAGVNHNGDTSIALELIRKAKAAGADCVKFQTFDPDDLVASDAPKAAYQLETTDASESQLAMLRRLALPLAAFKQLHELCLELDLVFLSTPYGFDDVDYLESLGVPAFKVASAQLVEPPLLEYIARKGRPVFVSTGLGTAMEVEEAVNVFHRSENRNVALLQCTSDYPAFPRDTNLRAMVVMRERYGGIVGYSDHTQSPAAALGAVALGAKIVERHFTLSKSMWGPDQRISADPTEFRELVALVREVESALGNGEKSPVASELRNTYAMRRSIAARRPIPRGTLLEAAALTLKRPACGIAPRDWDILLGRKTLRDIAGGEVLRWSDVEA